MLSNSDIQKLLSVLATKEDLKNLATKDDLNEVRSELSEVKTELNEVKVDLNEIKVDLSEVKTDLKDLNEKVDVIVDFTRTLDEDTDKRLKRVEKHLNLPALQT